MPRPPRHPFRPSAVRLLALALAAALFSGPASADPIGRDEVKRLRKVDATLAANIAELEANITPSKELAAYEREFRRAVPDVAPKPLSAARWAERLKTARVVMLGDDHATTRSQENTVKVLELMARGERPLTLVLEWIDRRYQADVNRFLAGEVPPLPFAKRIEFHKTWGFSWAAYLEVLRAAKRLKVPVLLVERLYERPGLARRDAMIAADVKAYRAAHPKARLLVVYGEYHALGPGHLTDRLARAGVQADIVIVGDAEAAFWRLLERTLDPDQVAFAELSDRILFQKCGTPLERKAGYRRYLMKLLGWTADDLSEWVAEKEIKPVSDREHRSGRLHELELAPQGAGR